MRRQIECDAQALLPACEILAIEGIALLDRAKAGILVRVRPFASSHV